MLDNGDRPHVKPGPVKYTKGFTTKRIFSKIVNSIIIIIIAIIVALSIFIYVKQPVKTADGFVTAKPIYEMIEHGEKILVVEDDNFNLFSPLKRFIITQEVYPARVIAGPYGKIEQISGKFRVSNGDSIASVNLENPADYLDLEYVVRKMDEDGEFIKDELDVIITKDNVLGSLIK